MAEQRQWETRRVDDWTELEIRGVIDEFFDFGPLLERAGPKVRVDLSGVHRINSSGVREWIRFLRQLTADREVKLLRCADVMVRQFNMIVNMTTGTSVESVQLHYTCQSCSHEQVDTLVLGPSVEIEEEVPCPACGQTMLFDSLPQAYLAFLKSR